MIFCKLGPRSLFSFLRQPTTRHCPHSHAAAASRLLLTAGRAAIDRYLLHDGPSAANPLKGQTDGRTDGRPTVAQTVLSMGSVRNLPDHIRLLGLRSPVMSAVSPHTPHQSTRRPPTSARHWKLKTRPWVASSVPMSDPVKDAPLRKCL